MKKIALLFFLTLCTAALGQSVPFQKLGHPFKTQTNFNLVWDAPTNELPSALWAYRASPSKVSPTVVSNLMALGSFTAKDREKVPGYPKIISYAEAGGKRSFRINPDWAFIEYIDYDADDMHITEGVPSAGQAFEIASNWLPKLGVDRDQLAKKPHNSELQFHVGDATAVLYKSRDGPASATNLYAREVSFMRSLDGVQISGGCARGGCSIQIGHHGKISRILASWRNYQRDKSYPVAEPEVLLKWIREGKAVWWYREDVSPYPDWSSIRKMIITKVTPYYYSEGYSEYDTPLNWAVPFAELEARIESDQTNSMIYLDCPIIDDKKP